MVEHVAMHSMDNEGLFISGRISAIILVDQFMYMLHPRIFVCYNEQKYFYWFFGFMVNSIRNLLIDTQLTIDHRNVKEKNFIVRFVAFYGKLPLTICLKLNC